MEKPNTKKDISITSGRIASRIPLTLDKSKSDAHLNSVYPKKVNSGPARTHTICNKLALSKSIMAKPGQNIFKFKLLSARHKDETSDISKTFQKT